MFTDFDIQKVSIPWTSDSSGAASVTTDVLIGVLLQAEFVPAAAPNAPSAYGATLKDENGYDLFAGQATSRSATVVQRLAGLVTGSDGTTAKPVMPAVRGKVTLAITSAGNAKQGTVILFLR